MRRRFRDRVWQLMEPPWATVKIVSFHTKSPIFWPYHNLSRILSIVTHSNLIWAPIVTPDRPFTMSSEETPSSWSPSYRANLPSPKYNPSKEDLADYHKGFLGILDKLVADPFFQTPDATTGRKVEGKRFPELDPANDDSLTDEQKEYMASPTRTKVGPGNVWSRSPQLARVGSNRTTNNMGGSVSLLLRPPSFPRTLLYRPMKNSTREPRSLTSIYRAPFRPLPKKSGSSRPPATSTRTLNGSSIPRSFPIPSSLIAN